MSIEEKIEAVKFLLASSLRYPIEADRENAITEKANENPSVAVYAEFSKEQLTDQLFFLQRQLSAAGAAGAASAEGIPNAVPNLSFSPSNATSEKIKNVQGDDRCYSICANQFVLMATLTFSKVFVEQTELPAESNTVYNNLYRNDDAWGYFGSEQKVLGVGHTTQLVTDLGKAYRVLDPDDAHKATLLHQGAINRAKPDMSMYLNVEAQTEAGKVTVSHPTCCLEAAIVGSYEKKLAQLSAVVNEIMHLMPIATFWTPVLAAVLLLDTQQMEVWMYSLGKYGEKIVIPRILIGECKISKRAMHALLKTMYDFNMQIKAFCSNVTNFQSDAVTFKPDQNVLVDTQATKVYKAFDYRTHKNIIARKRSANVFFEVNNLFEGKLLQDLQYELQWDAEDLRVISYAMVEGNHLPEHIWELLCLFEILRKMWRAGLVHGDLRLGNVVFSHNRKLSYPVVLIDFDYSGLQNEVKYATGFNHAIEDGKRHHEATENSYLQIKHDMFAFVEICRLFDVTAAAPVTSTSSSSSSSSAAASTADSNNSANPAKRFKVADDEGEWADALATLVRIDEYNEAAISNFLLVTKSMEDLPVKLKNADLEPCLKKTLATGSPPRGNR